MAYDDFVAGVQRLVGDERGKAYKEGFTHGVQFAENSTNSTLTIIHRAFDNVLSQVYHEYGRGKEYKMLVECLNAIRDDITTGNALPENRGQSE